MSGFTAMELGAALTVGVAITAFVSPLITLTVPSSLFATYTRLWTLSTVIATGLAPTVTCVMPLVAPSITTTSPVAELAT